jgi:hypothetical protein
VVVSRAISMPFFLRRLSRPVGSRSRAWLLVRACVVALPLAIGLTSFVACEKDQEIAVCGEIPVGGCPVGRGGSCLDPLCAGLYDCVGGAWTLTTACPPAEGSDGGDAGEAGPSNVCTPFVVGVEAGAQNCTPDLEVPDCPIEAAECVESACTTGCTDFYVCEPDGWLVVASCDDQGHLSKSP